MTTNVRGLTSEEITGTATTNQADAAAATRTERRARRTQSNLAGHGKCSVDGTGRHAIPRGRTTTKARIPSPSHTLVN